MPLPNSVQRQLERLDRDIQQRIETITRRVDNDIRALVDTLERLHIRLLSQLKGYSVTYVDKLASLADKQFRALDALYTEFEKASAGLLNKLVRSLLKALTFTTETFIDRIDKAVKETLKQPIEVDPLISRFMRFTIGLFDRIDSVFETVFLPVFEQRLARLIHGYFTQVTRLQERLQLPKRMEHMYAHLFTTFGRFTLEEFDRMFAKTYGRLIREIRSITAVYDVQGIVEESKTIFDFIANVLVRVLRQITTIASVVPLLRDFLMCKIKECEEKESPILSKVSEIEEIVRKFYEYYVKDREALKSALQQMYAKPTGLLGIVVGITSAFAGVVRGIKEIFTAADATERELRALFRQMEQIQELSELIQEYRYAKGWRKLGATLRLLRKRFQIVLDHVLGRNVQEVAETVMLLSEKGADLMLKTLRTEYERATTPIQRQLIVHQAKQILEAIKRGEIEFVPGQALSDFAIHVLNQRLGIFNEEFFQTLMERFVAELLETQQQKRFEKVLAQELAKHFKGLRIYAESLNTLYNSMVERVEELQRFINEFQKADLQTVLRELGRKYPSPLQWQVIEQSLKQVPQQLEEIRQFLEEHVIQPLTLVQQLEPFLENVQVALTVGLSSVFGQLREVPSEIERLFEKHRKALEEPASATLEAVQRSIQNIESEAKRFTDNIEAIVDTIDELMRAYNAAVAQGLETEAMQILNTLEQLRSTVNAYLAPLVQLPENLLYRLEMSLRDTRDMEKEIRKRLERLYELRRVVVGEELEQIEDQITAYEQQLKTILFTRQLIQQAIEFRRKTFRTRVEKTLYGFVQVLWLFEDGVIKLLSLPLSTIRFVTKQIQKAGDALAKRSIQFSILWTGVVRPVQLVYDRLTQFATYIRDSLDRTFVWLDNLVRKTAEYITFELPKRLPFGATLARLIDKTMGSLIRPIYDAFVGTIGRLLGLEQLKEVATKRIKRSKLLADLIEKTATVIPGVGTLGEKLESILKKSETPPGKAITIPETLAQLTESTHAVRDVLEAIHETIKKAYDSINVQQGYLRDIRNTLLHIVLDTDTIVEHLKSSNIVAGESKSPKQEQQISRTEQQVFPLERLLELMEKSTSYTEAIKNACSQQQATLTQLVEQAFATRLGIGAIGLNIIRALGVQKEIGYEDLLVAAVVNPEETPLHKLFKCLCEEKRTKPEPPTKPPIGLVSGLIQTGTATGFGLPDLALMYAAVRALPLVVRGLNKLKNILLDSFGKLFSLLKTVLTLGAGAKIGIGLPDIPKGDEPTKRRKGLLGRAVDKLTKFIRPAKNILDKTGLSKLAPLVRWGFRIGTKFLGPIGLGLGLLELGHYLYKQVTNKSRADGTRVSEIPKEHAIRPTVTENILNEVLTQLRYLQTIAVATGKLVTLNTHMIAMQRSQLELLFQIYKVLKQKGDVEYEHIRVNIEQDVSTGLTDYNNMVGVYDLTMSNQRSGTPIDAREPLQ